MNAYCISRSTYKTYSSIRNPETGEFTSLQKGYNTIPAYGDSTWKNPEELRRLRQDLGVEDQGYCFVSYRYNSQFPHEADEIKAAMEQAGFPNVHMVADVDAVMAYYRHCHRKSGSKDIVNADKGMIVTGIFCDTLYATLCRRGFRQTASIRLWLNEDDSFYRIPEGFFEKLSRDWGEVSAIMYHGYYGLCNEMRDCLTQNFHKAIIYSSWKEIEGDGHMNLQHALEWMFSDLDRCRSIIQAWNHCAVPEDFPGSESGLFSRLTNLFRNSILPELKKMSDLGEHAYDALGKWARMDYAYTQEGKSRRMNKSMLNYQAKCHLTQSFEDQKENFMRKVLPGTAEKIIQAIYQEMELPDIPHLSSADILLKLPGIFADFYSTEVCKVLEEKLDFWWKIHFDLLDEGWFAQSRSKQLKNRDTAQQLAKTRMNCRQSILNVLKGKFDLDELCARFVHTVLHTLREILTRELKGSFSPVMVEFDTQPELAAVPNEYELECRYAEDFFDDFKWNDEKDLFPPVSTARPSEDCDSAPESDNYTVGTDGIETYWFESID